MVWHSIKVLVWRLSNSMSTAFLLGRHSIPVVQGSWFTSGDLIEIMTYAKIKISMDGEGRWINNWMLERLWWSLKYEYIYLLAFESDSETKVGIRKWLTYCNGERPHPTNGILTPDEAYQRKLKPMSLAVLNSILIYLNKAAN